MGLLLKDKPDTDPPGMVDYRQTLVRARRRQLILTQENLRRMESVYEAAAASLRAQISSLPDYMLTEEGYLAQQYYRDALRRLDETLTNLRADYGKLLNGAMLETAQAAAERERDVGAVVNAPPDRRLEPLLSQTVELSEATQVQVRFGTAAKQAVETVSTRYYRDGLKLSDRLYNLDRVARQAVEDTITQAVAEGISAPRLAERLEGSLEAAGGNSPRYQAMRIARTEINNAYREAHILSAIDPNTGTLKGFIQGIGWRLSLSHKQEDICDIWASYDGDGLGAGVYYPGNTPVDHPHGLCYTISVLKAYPDVAVPGKKPNPDAVPESQITYYAERVGDPAAQARMGN